MFNPFSELEETTDELLETYTPSDIVSCVRHKGTLEQYDIENYLNEYCKIVDGKIVFKN